MNQSLLRLVFNKENYALSDDLSDELDALAGDQSAGPEAIRLKLNEVGLATVANAGALVAFADRDAELAGRNDFLAIESCAILGLFPQSSSDLLQDYDGLIQELSRSGTGVSALLAAGATMLPEGIVGETPTPPPCATAPVALGAPVILADPSQRSVIADCRRHGATVVDGPPGTGKSQVIVNLVAEELRRGGHVAVVCEKRAALDVVAQRLENLGLRHAVAVVHDVHEDRKPLYEQIADRLDTVDPHTFEPSEAEKARAEHATIGAGLEARASALRATDEGLEISTGELFTLAAGLNAPPITAPPGLDGISQGSLRSLIEVAESLHPLRDLWGPSSFWRTASSTPRPSLGKSDPRALRALEGQIDAAVESARRYEALRA